MTEIARALVDHQAELLAYAKRHAPRGVEAEDLLGQVSERALSRASQARDEPRAWLFTILRSKIADAFRVQGRVGRRDATLKAAPREAVVDTFERPDRILEDGLSCDCYADFIADRDDPSVDALRRVAVDEQNAKEAAAELGITPGAFHVRLHRARKRVQTVLRDRCGVTSIREARDCDCSSGCG